MRGLAIVALVVAVFALVGALTFPTDALVRAVLRRVPLPAGTELAFTAAHLGWNGIRLEQVRLARAGGRRGLDAEWLRLWPSLPGVWRDGTGRPWTVGAAVCEGTIELGIGVEPRATPIDVGLEHVELGTCLPVVIPRIEASGRVDGTFRVRLGMTDPPRSDGALALRGGAWKPGGPLEDVALRADAGALAWRLADRLLEITTLQATSSDFDAVGAGVVRVADRVDDSLVDLRVTVTPGRTMPPLLRRYLDAAPGAPSNERGARTFRIQGTLRDPRLLAVAPALPSSVP
jgi:type II secretion system protein N